MELGNKAGGEDMARRVAGQARPTRAKFATADQGPILMNFAVVALLALGLNCEVHLVPPGPLGNSAATPRTLLIRTSKEKTVGQLKQDVLKVTVPTLSLS